MGCASSSQVQTDYVYSRQNTAASIAVELEALPPQNVAKKTAASMYPVQATAQPQVQTTQVQITSSHLSARAQTTTQPSTYTAQHQPQVNTAPPPYQHVQQQQQAVMTMTSSAYPTQAAPVPAPAPVPTQTSVPVPAPTPAPIIAPAPASKPPSPIPSAPPPPSATDAPTSVKQEAVVTVAMIKNYQSVSQLIDSIEQKNTVAKLDDLIKEQKEVQNEIRNTDAEYAKLGKNMQKEYTEFKQLEAISQTSIMQYFKSHHSFAAQLSKEEQEYIEAKTKYEHCYQDLMDMHKQNTKMTEKIEALKKEKAELASLYDQQEKILETCFGGTYGSKLEDELETKLDDEQDKRERVQTTMGRWKTALALSRAAANQLTFAVKRWTDVMRIQGMNAQVLRMQLIGEVRNYLIAALKNLTTARKNVQPAKFPYCDVSEMQTLNKAINFIFIDGMFKDRHDYAGNVYKTTSARCNLLIRWIASVIDVKITSDLETSRMVCVQLQKSLRHERVRLMKEKVEAETGDTVSVDESDSYYASVAAADSGIDTGDEASLESSDLVTEAALIEDQPEDLEEKIKEAISDQEVADRAAAEPVDVPSTDTGPTAAVAGAAAVGAGAAAVGVAATVDAATSDEKPAADEAEIAAVSEKPSSEIAALEVPPSEEAVPEAVAEPTPEAVVETAPEAVAEISPETVAEPAPESVVEKAPEAVVEAAPEVVVEPTTADTVEPTTASTAEPTPEAVAEPDPETKLADVKPADVSVDQTADASISAEAPAVGGAAAGVVVGAGAIAVAAASEPDPSPVPVATAVASTETAATEEPEEAPKPLEELAPPPSQNELFGDLDSIMAEHARQQEVFQKERDLARQRQQQQFREQLRRRKSRKMRRMRQAEDEQ